MSNISFELRRTVEARAKGRCEYCGLSQEGQEATFHIDHIALQMNRRIILAIREEETFLGRHPHVQV